MEVDQKILFSISLGATTIFECKALAVYLNVDHRLVMHLTDRSKDPREIAFEILRTWARTTEATPRKLYDALFHCELDSLQALAWRFRDQLCKDQGKLLKS